MVRLAVTGGRTYANGVYVWQALDWFHFNWPVEILIHGDATGADTLCRQWAESRRVPHWPFPVMRSDWRTLGKRAGPLRNQRMIDEGRPTYLIAFPGNSGTQSMISLSQDAGIPILKLQ